MADIFKTIIVAAADVEAAKLACATVAGGGGMFSVQLAPTADAPAPTHFASSGLMPEEILPLMWPSAADISDDQPFDALTRLGLVMWSEPI